MMPYSDALQSLAFWFRQLWAESLGKAKTVSGETVNAGQTPVVALGATDQHSQLQLYLEGPFDKLITFLLVGNTASDVEIPAQPGDFSYLGGHTLGELLNIEARATRLALAESGRSNMSFILPEINPFTIGQLLFLFQLQTVFAAGLYNIDPMGQPAVEKGKRYAYGMLGRDGFGDKAAEIEELQDRAERYIV
jgi:glucose-6-phosphate isomerase